MQPVLEEVGLALAHAADEAEDLACASDGGACAGLSRGGRRRDDGLEDDGEAAGAELTLSLDGGVVDGRAGEGADSRGEAGGDGVEGGFIVVVASRCPLHARARDAVPPFLVWPSARRHDAGLPRSLQRAAFSV